MPSPTTKTLRHCDKCKDLIFFHNVNAATDRNPQWVPLSAIDHIDHRNTCEGRKGHIAKVIDAMIREARATNGKAVESLAQWKVA